MTDTSQQIEIDLLEAVNNVVRPYGCEATTIGPNTVGVQGDARVYCPCVFVRFPHGTPYDVIDKISNEITNRVPSISRVCMEL